MRCSRVRIVSGGGESTSRHGFTLVEMISAMILLGVLFTVSISILAAVARERRIAEQRQFAMQHATNLLERTTALGWSELSPGPLMVAPVPAEMQFLLPNLKQHIEVSTLPESFNSKLVKVSLTWQNREGQMISPVRLSAWVYPLEEVSQ